MFLLLQLRQEELHQENKATTNRHYSIDFELPKLQAVLESPEKERLFQSVDHESLHHSFRDIGKTGKTNMHHYFANGPRTKVPRIHVMASNAGGTASLDQRIQQALSQLKHTKGPDAHKQMK